MSDYLGRIITKNPTYPSPTAASGVWTLDEALQYQKAGKWPPGYAISRSVRLRSSASAYLQRTPASTSNRQTYTWSGWVKRGLVAAGTYYGLFTAGQVTGGDDGLFFDTTAGALYFTPDQAATSTLISSSVYRDPSAWYHIVLAVDTTQATSTNRIKMYVNGVQLTSFSTATYPAQNLNSTFINTANIHRIGAHTNAGYYFDGYLTEINFIDGQQLTPASFGYADTATGVWQPLPYTGTYGTNGFYLNFSDNSAATAAAIGKDYSGNGNNFTPNNISVTAGATYDSMVDSPSSYGSDTGVGGEVRGDYCVLNPISNPNSPLYTVSNGNLTYSCSSSAGNAGRMSIAGTVLLGTAKWYWECTPTDTNGGFGIGSFKDQAFDVNSSGPGSSSYVLCFSSGAANLNAGTLTYTGSAFSYVANDVIGLAYDGTANSLAFYKNGSLIGTYTGINAASWLPAMFVSTGGASTNFSINFGQRAFSYTAPSGFKALNTQNLSVPTINNGANYMAATLYIGNGSTQTITNTVNGVSFAPDFAWVKVRSTAGTDHYLADTIRGATKYLQSNTTAAEGTNNGITAFNSNGFSVGAVGDTNTNGATIVGWNWKAGGTAVSNTSGSITSTVSANPTAGFSVVGYTGNGVTSATVGHGLGVTPSMVIVKSRSAVADWFIWHTSLSSGYQLRFTTAAQEQVSSATTAGGLGTPTSTTIGFISGSINTNNVNTNAATYVAYCFAAIAGYSAFGTYTGNGSADGPFVYTGFRPRWVLVKNYDLVSGENWYLIDSSRNTYNVASSGLFPNLTNAEGGTNVSEDFLSNGFKIRATGTPLNNSGGTYIYAAFAENPFKYARAR